MKTILGNSNSRSGVSEHFPKVNCKFRQYRSRPRKHKKIDLISTNCYETLYITDCDTESEGKDSDYITNTYALTDNNIWPGYTHRIHQWNDNLKEVNKKNIKLQKPQIAVMMIE